MKATLEIDGAEYPVIRYDLKFFRKMNRSTNTPKTRPDMEPLILTFPFIGDDKEFLRWHLDDRELKDVIFTIIPNGLSNRDLPFELYEVRCNQFFHKTVSTGRLIRKEITLHLEPGVVRYRGREFRRPWATVDLARRDQKPMRREDFVEENNALKILSSHYETLEGERLEDLENGMVHLIVESENWDNKIVDLDLSDEEHDFIYQGKRLKNDQLKGLRLTGAITTVVLEVVDQQDNSEK